MDIIVIGLNHKTAPVEVREKLAIPEKNLINALGEIGNGNVLRERVIISTCNRVEVYAVADEVEEAREFIISFFEKCCGISRNEFEQHLYQYYSLDAVRHIFRVSSSLDSMIIGEPQILGQVKNSFSCAQEANAVGNIFSNMFNHALNVAKRIRSETGIAKNAVSVSYAAIELAKKIFGSLKDKSILILGAGKMSELAAKHLISGGVSSVFVTNRTYERAIELAEMFKGKAVKFDEIFKILPLTDIVISSTGAPHYIIKKEDIHRVLHARRNKPIFFIDIAVPRDIEPAVNDLDNVYLYDIDDLQTVVEANIKERMREAQKAEEIIFEELKRFTSWWYSKDIVPVIISLREKFENIRQKEMTKAYSRINNIDTDTKKIIDTITTSILNKILHMPISRLKSLSESGNGLNMAKVIQSLFELEIKETEKDKPDE